MPILRLVDAGFRFPGESRWIFRHLNLEIREGRTIRVRGRNGSGKSTLLKVLGGHLGLTEGTVERTASSPIAYMNQFCGDMLAPDLTLIEQVRSAVRDPKGEMAVLEMLRSFDLSLQARLDAFVGHLSGGERQILALLCTLGAGASLICLDEFVSALDEGSTLVAESILRTAKERGRVALVIVSHIESGVVSDEDLNLHDSWRNRDG